MSVSYAVKVAQIRISKLMKIHPITNIGTATNADLYTIAVNKLECTGLDSFLLYVTQQDPNATLLTSVVGGDNQPIAQVTPEFFPFATAGAECAAVVTSLDWADQNLNDYEYIKGDAGAAGGRYIVFGTLNSTATEFNDPFEAPTSPDDAVRQTNGFVSGCCWKGSPTSNFPH